MVSSDGHGTRAGSVDVGLDSLIDVFMNVLGVL